MSTWQAPPPTSAGWEVGAPAPGAAAERYVRLGDMGAGGMGTVALGWDTWLQRNVALKIPHGPPGSAMEAALSREALLAAQLDHPAIVSVLDLTRDPEGRTVFVMRVARGRPLTEWLALGRRAPVLRGLVAVAEAVSHAHERGVVHRDLSPHNVLLGEHGEVSILDWGIAARAGEVTGRGGTPGYAAPEQLAGAAAAPAADVYSLGRLLGDALGPDASPELRAIVDRATAADPGARYPDAAALHADLMNWADGRLVDAYAYRPWQLVRHAARAARVPLAVAAIVGVVVIGQAVTWTARLRAEQARVVAAEAAARSALADARAEQALSAWRVGDEHAAHDLALAALAVGPQPMARGLVATTVGWPRWEDRVLAALPPCPRWMLPEPGDVALCVAEGGARAWVDGAPAWTFAGQVVEARRQGTEVWLLDHLRARWRLDAATGAVVDHAAGPFSFIHPTRAVLADHAGVRLAEADAPASPCGVRMHVAAPAPDGGWWFGCQDGSIREVTGGRVTLHQAPTRDAAGLLVPIRDEVWAINAAGRLTRLRGAPAQIELGEPVRGVSEVAPGLLLVHGRNGRARLLDTATATWRLDLAPGASVMAAADGRIRAIRGGRLVEIEVPPAFPQVGWRLAHGVSSLAWEPDGTHLRVGDGAGALHRLDAAGVDPPRADVWQHLVLKWVDVGPDGAVHASAMGAPAVRVWGPSGVPVEVPTVLQEPARRTLALAGGQRLTLTYGGHVYRWDDVGVEEVLYEDGTADLARDAAGVEVAIVTPRGVVRWRPGQAPALALPGTWVAADVEGDRLVAAAGAEVEVHDGAAVHRWTVGASVVDVALGDGVVVVGAMDGTVTVARPDGAVLAVLPAHADRVGAIDVSADGRRVASGGWDGTVRVLDLGALAP